MKYNKNSTDVTHCHSVTYTNRRAYSQAHIHTSMRQDLYFRGQSSEVKEGIIIAVVLHLLLQPDVVWVDRQWLSSCQGLKHGLGPISHSWRERGRTERWKTFLTFNLCW